MIVGAVAVVLLALVAGAFTLESSLADGEAASEVLVTRDGKTLGRFSIDELRALETVEFKQAGISETGPSVLRVLDEAGAGEFDRLTALGLGVRDDGILVLRREEVTEQVILDFAETRGTVKLAGPDISRDQRVRDVVELRVE